MDKSLSANAERTTITDRNDPRAAEVRAALVATVRRLGWCK